MIWSLFKRPATFNDTPRQHLYTVALSEEVPELTDHWRGEHLMKVAATSEADAKEKALLKAHRFGIRLKTSDIISVRGGERDA